MSESPPLTRLDWTVAAMAAMAKGGVDAVKVEPLAKAMNVSRGSFYWHFKDRADLLTSVLDHWEAQFTDGIIANASGHSSAADRLRAVAREALDDETIGVNVAGIEDALRAWSVDNPEVRDRIGKVDDSRVGYLALELGHLGYDSKTALQLARMIYLALIGLSAARHYNPALADDDGYILLVDLIIERSPYQG